MERKGKTKGYGPRKTKSSRNAADKSEGEAVATSGRPNSTGHNNKSMSRGNNLSRSRRGSWRGNKYKYSSNNQQHSNNSMAHKNSDNYGKASYSRDNFSHYNSYDQWDSSYNSQFSKWQGSNVTWFDDHGLPENELMGMSWSNGGQLVPSSVSDFSGSSSVKDAALNSASKKSAFVYPYSSIPFHKEVASSSSNVKSATTLTTSSLMAQSTNVVTSASTSVVSSTTPNALGTGGVLDLSSKTSPAAAMLRQRSKSSSESEEHAKDSHSLGLSLKASEIIDSILRGEKVQPRFAEASLSANARGAGEDVIERAEKLCQKLRAERERAKQKQDSARCQITEGGSHPEMTSSRNRSKESNSGTSERIPAKVASGFGDKSTTDVGSAVKLTTGSSSQGTQRLVMPRSLSLKDSILRMLRYPKSRRGTSQIERLLQQSKVPDSSRQRLMNLMKPLSEPEKPQFSFLQLAPDVQQHILSIVDEVMLEMELEDDVVMVDEDEQGSSSLHHRDNGNSSFAKVPVSVDGHCEPSVSAGLVDIPDIKHHFDDLLTGTSVLQQVSNSSLHDNVERTTAHNGKTLTRGSDRQQVNTLHATVVKRENTMDTSGNELEYSADVKGVRAGMCAVSDGRSVMPKVSDIEAMEAGSSVVPSGTSGTEDVGTGQLDAQGSMSNIKTCSSQSRQIVVGRAENIADSALQRAQSSDCVSLVKTEPNDESYDRAVGGVSSRTPNTSSSKTTTTPVNNVANTSLAHPEPVVMDTTEDVPTTDSVTTASNKKQRTKRPREKTTLKSVVREKSSVDRAVAKRPKVKEADGHSTNDVVDELYNIAIEEEELREKMAETDKTIKELQELLDVTKARLECREKYRRELEERETYLRKQRLSLLKDAKTSSRRTSLESVNNLSNSCLSDGSEKGKTKKKSKKKLKSAACNDNTMEPDTTVDVGSNVTDNECIMEQEVNPSQKKTKKSSKQKIQKQSSADDGSIDVDGKDVPVSQVDMSASELNCSGSMSIKYLGSFLGGDDVHTVLKHLSQNFKNLKPVTSLKVGDDIKIDLVELGSATSKNDDSASKESGTVSRPPASDHNNGQFKQPNETARKKNTAPVKTKKVVKKKVKTRSSVSIDSESDADPKPKEKKTPKKKKKDKGTSKIIKEYLHCTSSSDVELDGPQDCARKTPTSTKVDTTSYSSGDSDSSDDQADYISLNSVGKLNTKTKNTGVEGVFSETVKGPVSCLVTWRKYLLATGQDAHVKYLIKNKLYDAPTRILCNHMDQIKVLHVSSAQDQNGSVYMYTGSLDKSLVISNFNTGIYMSQHQCSAPIRCGSPGWGKLYLGLDDGTLVTFDIQRYRIEHTYSAANSAIVQLATGQEGARRLICLCEQYQPTITLRDARSKLFIRSLEGHTKTPLVLKVKNHQIYSGGADNMVQIHNIATGNMESLMRFQSAVTQIVVSSMLIVGEKRGVISIIQHKDQVRERVIYTYDQSPVSALLFEKPQNMLYIGDESGRLEAVSLSSESFKCQFSLCSGYAFGQRKHMLQHLISDHVAPCIKGKVLGIDVEQLPHIFKCLWKDCKDYIYIKNSTREAEEHMSSHVNEVFDAKGDE